MTTYQKGVRLALMADVAALEKDSTDISISKNSRNACLTRLASLRPQLAAMDAAAGAYPAYS